MSKQLNQLVSELQAPAGYIETPQTLNEGEPESKHRFTCFYCSKTYKEFSKYISCGKKTS